MKGEIADSVSTTRMPTSLLLKMLNSEFIKFCLIGGVTALIQLGSYWMLLRFNLFYDVASIISMAFSTVLAYIGNRIWTFRSFNRWWLEAIQFFFLRGITIALNAILLYVAVEEFHIQKMVAQIICLCLITVLNFTVGKFVVFKDGSEHTNNYQEF